MNHEFYTDRLSSYFDQELKNEEFVIVDEHVKQCVECQQLLAQYAKLDDTINRHAELDDTAYWEKSAQKIEAAIGGDQKTEVIAIPKSTYKGLWWKISGLAASIAILAFISLYEKDITNDLDQQISPAPVLKKAQPADSVVIVESPDQYRQNPAREESVPVDNLVSKEEKTDQPAVGDIIDADAIEPKKVLSKTKVDQSINQPGEADKVQNETVEESPSVTSPPKKIESNVSSGKRSLEKSLSDGERTKIAAQKLNESIVPGISPKSAASELQSAGKKHSDEFEAESEPLAEADENILGYWQNTVVSNQIVLDTQKKQIIAYKKGLVKDEEQQQILNIRDEKELYTGMFEGYYNIALLTEDSTERIEAISILKKYARDLGFDYSAEANSFLYKYDSVQSVLNRQQKRK